MSRRQGLLAGAAVVAGLALSRLALATQDNGPSLPYTQDDQAWWDERRQRAVPVRLYAPADTSAGPSPLLVFSHGIGGSRAGYGYLGRYLASHGVFSLHVQHVGSDRQLWAGNPFGLVERLQGAAQDAEAVARVHDLRFAMDQVLSAQTALRIDERRIVAAGHSYGANTALLASGAQVLRGGQPVALRDERIRAAVLLSAPPFYGEPSMVPILGPIALPSLHITTTEDVIRIPGYVSGPEDRVKVYEAMGGAQKWLAMFGGGAHSHFVGRRGEADPLLQATRELVLAFVHQVFDAEPLAMRQWLQRHATLVNRYTAPAGGLLQQP